LDQQKLWHKLDQQRSEIRQANEVVDVMSALPPKAAAAIADQRGS
jgi:hypothetical protein